METRVIIALFKQYGWAFFTVLNTSLAQAIKPFTTVSWVILQR